MQIKTMKYYISTKIAKIKSPGNHFKKLLSFTLYHQQFHTWIYIEREMSSMTTKEHVLECSL